MGNGTQPIQVQRRINVVNGVGNVVRNMTPVTLKTTAGQGVPNGYYQATEIHGNYSITPTSVSAGVGAPQTLVIKQDQKIFGV